MGLAAETGGTFPALTEKPNLSFGDEFYLNSFFRLSSSRSVGMGVGNIPLSEIILYCDWIEESEPEVFVEIIQFMDSVYLDLQNKKNESKKK